WPWLARASTTTPRHAWSATGRRATTRSSRARACSRTHPPSVTRDRTRGRAANYFLRPLRRPRFLALNFERRSFERLRSSLRGVLVGMYMGAQLLSRNTEPRKVGQTGI